MAKADLTMTVRILDMEEFRLFVWELRMLADEMRVSADPFAERLERAIDRFTDDPEERE